MFVIKYQLMACARFAHIDGCCLQSRVQLQRKNPPQQLGYSQPCTVSGHFYDISDNFCEVWIELISRLFCFSVIIVLF